MNSLYVLRTLPAYFNAGPCALVTGAPYLRIHELVYELLDHHICALTYHEAELLLNRCNLGVSFLCTISLCISPTFLTTKRRLSYFFVSFETDFHASLGKLACKKPHALQESSLSEAADR